METDGDAEEMWRRTWLVWIVVRGPQGGARFGCSPRALHSDEGQLSASCALVALAFGDVGSGGTEEVERALVVFRCHDVTRWKNMKKERERSWV